MRDFEYHRPGSLAGVVDTLRATRGAKLLAGGQSLLPLLKHDLAAPPTLVSLAGVAELRDVARERDAVRIGAAVTHAEVASSPVVREAIPALTEMARGIGDPQVRNRGTLGGSLAHDDPAADYPAAVLALDATVVTDRREIAADDFFRGMFRTALEDDEVVAAVRFPVPERAAYAKFPSPASRYAVVGVMVAARAGEVRVAVTGAGRGVFRVEAMERALAADLSESALDGISIPAHDLVTDLDASAEYRAHLVGVMARRAVRACA